MGARRAIERDDGAVEVWKKEARPRIKDRGGPRRVDRLRRRLGLAGQRPRWEEPMSTIQKTRLALA
jgi:hypothetical protein